MDNSIAAIQALLNEVTAMDLSTVGAIKAQAGSQNVDALKAELQKLQEENAVLSSRYAPNLKRRVPLFKLLANGDEYIGKSIGVGGWIRTTRNGGGGKFLFLKVYDGTVAQELQVVVDGKCEGFQELAQAGNGTSLFITGTVVPSMGKEQKVEMQASKVRVLGQADPVTYPLAGKNLTLEYLRIHQHMRPRSMVLGAVSRIRNTLAFATHQYFQQGGFKYINTPLITASDCEGAGEMFQVTTLLEDGKMKEVGPDGKADYSKDFFKKPSYLTVSGQLNAEIYAHALSSVYTFGPTFRAENSNTSRHLSEFWMIEPEIAFADLEENMNVAEGFLRFVLKACLDRNNGDLQVLEDFEKKRLGFGPKPKWEKKAKGQADKKGDKKDDKKKKGGKKTETKEEEKPVVKDWRSVPLRDRIKNITSSQFARITYTAAIDLLLGVIKNGHHFENEVYWGVDMASEHERYLCEVHFQRPTIVTDYPRDIKAFYMRGNDDGKTCAAMDILVPGVGELIGGSQREERYGVLVARLKEMNLEEESYSWYLDLRRFGSVVHSGFGAGFERLVCYATGMENIRDSIPFPRYPGHAEF